MGIYRIVVLHALFPDAKLIYFLRLQHIFFTYLFTIITEAGGWGTFLLVICRPIGDFCVSLHRETMNPHQSASLNQNTIFDL